MPALVTHRAVQGCQIEGMRQGWVGRMIQNAPKPTRANRASRVGWLNALYCLLAETSPPSVLRSPDMWRFRAALVYILRGLDPHFAG